MRYLLPAFFCVLLTFSFSSAEDYEVADGITVTSAVLPGLTRHPMAAAFDDRGRLFIAESSGVNESREELLENPPHLIRLLTDTNGDGVFDQSQVFADQMVFPQGVLWVYDALYVMSPPSLWRLTDTNGDGVADMREELAGEFDFTANAADVHGPFLHPNGRLYWAHGRKNFRLIDRDSGEILEEGAGARIWSSTLDGDDVECFAGGGMDNPVEIDFTPEGEIIGTVNLFYGRPRGDTLVHWVHGGVYPRHDMGWVTETYPKTGDLLAPIHDFGHVAVSGMCRYRSGKVHPDWAGQWFVTHFNTSRLTRTKLRREGASFAPVETETVFRLLQPDAHLTDVLEAPNGDLLVVDTGGWFRRGCPNSQIAKPEVAGGIYRLSPGKRPAYRPAAFPDWDRLTSEETAAFLDAEEEWLQDRAITELAVRGAPAIPELELILESEFSGARKRRNAVWALTRMKFSESTDLIHKALQDPDPSVRQAACNGISATRSWQLIAANQPAELAIELERNRSISGTLAAMTRSDEPRVAAAAASALGRMGESRAMGAIAGRLARVGDDRFLEHALIYALIEIDDFEGTRPFLQSESAPLRPRALRALAEMSSSALEVLEVLPFLDSEDEGLSSVAIEIALQNPEWDAAVANEFFSWLDNLTPARRTVIMDLLPGFITSPPMQDFLTALLNSAEEENTLAALKLLGETSDLSFLPEWFPVLGSFLEDETEPSIRLATLEALPSAATDQFDERLRSIAGDENASIIERISASRAMVREGSVLHDEAFDLIHGILADEGPFEDRQAAMRILTSSPLSPEQKDRLAELLSSFGPLEIASFHDLFRKVDNAEQALTTAKALVSSPGFHSLEINRLRSVYSAFPEALELIEARAEEIEKERDQREARLSALLRESTEGNPERGATVFLSGQGACLVCHRVGKDGGEVGPDLTKIGSIRTARDLFESILYPGESISRDYETTEVILSTDPPSSLIGVIREQDSRVLTLVNPAGQKEQINKTEISSIRTLDHSLMPEGLDQTMSETDLRDLVAWLLSLE